jgi:hypothetical protein
MYHSTPEIQYSQSELEIVNRMSDMKQNESGTGEELVQLQKQLRKKQWSNGYQECGIIILQNGNCLQADELFPIHEIFIRRLILAAQKSADGAKRHYCGKNLGCSRCN